MGETIEAGELNKPDLIDECVSAVHDGLGGDGWAYTNYGNDELNTHRDYLGKAAMAVVNVLRKRGLLTLQGLELIKNEEAK